PCLARHGCLDAPASRGVAQPGSASHWGCGGRWFESSRPDHRRQAVEDCGAAGQRDFTESFSSRMSNASILMAMQAAPADQGSPMAAWANFFIPLILMFGVFWILVFRPQQRRVKEHQAAINAVKKGDEVITGGGIRGRVTKVTDDEAEAEIAQGVKVRATKSTLTHVATGGGKPANEGGADEPCWHFRAGRYGSARWSSWPAFKYQFRAWSRARLTPIAGRHGCPTTRSRSASTSRGEAPSCSRPTPATPRSNG